MRVSLDCVWALLLAAMVASFAQALRSEHVDRLGRSGTTLPRRLLDAGNLCQANKIERGTRLGGSGQATTNHPTPLLILRHLALLGTCVAIFVGSPSPSLADDAGSAVSSGAAISARPETSTARAAPESASLRSWWDIFGPTQFIEATYFTKVDAHEMEARMDAKAAAKEVKTDVRLAATDAMFFGLFAIFSVFFESSQDRMDKRMEYRMDLLDAWETKQDEWFDASYRKMSLFMFVIIFVTFGELYVSSINK